jgi:hypothetical protein
MSPTIQDGCVVLINIVDTKPKDGKIYAICKPDGGFVLKRLIFDYIPAIGVYLCAYRWLFSLHSYSAISREQASGRIHDSGQTLRY